MNKWLKQLLLQPLLVLFVLILIAGGAVAVLALSETGTRFLVNNLPYVLPNLTLTNVNGTLANGLSASSIVWENDAATVTATNVQLASEVEVASPPTLTVKQLQAEKVIVRLPESKEAADPTPFDLVSIPLPLTVHANHVTIGELEVWQGEHPLRLRDVQLAADAQDGQLHLTQLHTQIYDEQGQATIDLVGTMALDKPHALDMQLNVVADSKTWGKGKAQAKVGGELLQYTLDLNADWQYAQYPRYQGQLQGKGSFADLTFDRLFLTGTAGELTAVGQVKWQDALVWQADVNAKRLNPAIIVPEWPANLDLAFKSTGVLQDSALQTLTLDVSQLKGKLREYSVDAKGAGNWNGKTVNVQTVDAKVGDNRVQLSGSAADKLAIQWQIDAPKLVQLYPKIKGNAKGKGTLNGQIDGSQLQLVIEALDGKVEGYDLKAKGALEWGRQRLLAKDFFVESGNNRVDVSGQATEPFDLRWKVDAKNLAKAWKGLGGSLQGEGTLQGSLDKPAIQADLKGKQLRFNDYRVAKIDLVASQNGERYSVKGDVTDFVSGETLVKALKLDGEGSITNHQVSAEITHEQGKALFDAKGGWQNEQWRGTVSRLALRDTAVGAWDLTQAVNLVASARSFTSSTICLAHQSASLCAKPAWTNTQGVTVSGQARQLPLVMARPWLPTTIELPGNVNADYRFEQRAGKPQGSASIRLPDSLVTIRQTNGKTQTLQYTNAQADVTLNNRQVNAQAQLGLAGYGQIQADGRVDLSLNDGNHRLNATINADMPDISWLERFSPQIDELKGRANGVVTVGGTVKRPLIQGEARLSNAQVYLPETGVTLRNINLLMQSNSPTEAVVTGSLQAGSGTLQANGVLSLANLPQWRATVQLRGDNLQLMDTNEVQAYVSPNLQLQISPTQFMITGNVLIPQTTISLRELPQSASAYSEDVVIVGRRAKTTTTLVDNNDMPINIIPDVTITLGDQVKFSGFGLDGRLTGKLRILRTRQDIIGEGALSVVDGVYKAYGQNLTIETGRLVFNGALDNPGLDIKAVREVEDGDITVGISLAGTVKQPESTLFSSPTQTQSDTLSYLLTGRAMSSLSGDQSSLINEAITGLGIAGGESLAQQFGGKLGLDDVGLSAKNGNVEESELALGKRLGPKLYVRYIVGLFDSLQRLAITYDINKHLQLEAQTGDSQSLDVIYKIDTNKGLFGD